jgi:ketosteroid isomerase-like protein
VSSANVELVRRAVEGLNRGDAEEVISIASPDYEMHLVGVAQEPVFYGGADGIRELLRDLAESWESFELADIDVRDLGDRVLVLGELRGRGRVSGIDVGARRGFLFSVRDGKIRHLQAYLSPDEALAAAGLSE